MNDDPSDVNVLYARVDSPGLQSLADSIAAHFQVWTRRKKTERRKKKEEEEEEEERERTKKKRTQFAVS